MQTIHDLTSEIREHINGSFRHAVLPSTINHEQVFCSLDTIEDTDLAIEAYRTQPFPEHCGVQYLWINGVLQCLVVQQDAVTHLGACFGLRLNPAHDEGARKIRALRNSVVGHPTRQTQNVENGPCHNAISRISLHRDGFRRLRANKVRTEFDDVSLPEFFEIQDAFIQNHLRAVIQALTKLINEHAQKHVEPLSEMLKCTDELAQSLSRGETREVWRAVELVRAATLERLLSTHVSDYNEPEIRNALSLLQQQNDATSLERVRTSVARFRSELAQLDAAFRRRA